MKNELTSQQQQNILSAIGNIVSTIGLDDVKTNINLKAGTASITGNKNGIQYTTTLTQHLGGMVKTTSEFAINTGRDVLKTQIKDLKKQGFKQTEIADMLNISQPTVSKYLKK